MRRSAAGGDPWTAKAVHAIILRSMITTIDEVHAGRGHGRRLASWAVYEALTVERIPLTPLVVYSMSASTWLFFPATPWDSAPDWELIREMLETMNMPGGNDLEVTIGIQTCQTPNAVDTPAVALSALRSTDGLTFPGPFVDKTGTTGSKQLVRAGYLVKNETGSGDTQRFCWASGALEVKKK